MNVREVQTTVSEVQMNVSAIQIDVREVQMNVISPQILKGVEILRSQRPSLCSSGEY